MTAIGNSAKGSRLAFDFAATANVATPLLDMSDRSLTFHHTYIKDQPIKTLTKPLTLRNISKLPLTFALK
jgi:hydrocephalus-inducing protein